MIEHPGQAFALVLRGPILALAVAVVATACETGGEDGDVTRNAIRLSPESDPDAVMAETGREAELPAETVVELGTFSPEAELRPDADFLEDRLPAEGGQGILIPATTLFPGSVRLDPEIENPVAGDPQAIAAGERHFSAFNCAGCHMPLGGGGMGPPLSDDAWIYGDEPAQIYLSIMHGRPDGMPAWSAMLPSAVVWELIAYVDTLNEIDDYASEAGFDGEPPWPTTGVSAGASENAGGG